MSRLLIIDTSSMQCSVTLLDDDHVIHKMNQQNRKQAQHLLPLIEDVLNERQLTVKDLQGIAFSKGPGSFTGLRIAAAVVQGISMATDIPIYGLSSLSIIAVDFYQKAPFKSCSSVPIFVITNAHMGEVFWGCYLISDDAITPIIAERVGKPEECFEALDQCANEHATSNVAGDGISVLQDNGYSFANYVIDQEAVPFSGNMTEYVSRAFERGDFADFDSYPLVYLRDTVAWKKLSEQPSLLKK